MNGRLLLRLLTLLFIARSKMLLGSESKEKKRLARALSLNKRVNLNKRVKKKDTLTKRIKLSKELNAKRKLGNKRLRLTTRYDDKIASSIAKKNKGKKLDW